MLTVKEERRLSTIKSRILIDLFGALSVDLYSVSEWV